MGNEKSVVNSYQLRTNTIIDIKKLEQRVDYVDSFGREWDDPYYEGVRRFEDEQHPTEERYIITIEEQLEKLFGEHFFEDRKYLLFIVFSLVFLLLLLSCASICCCWLCRTRRTSRPAPRIPIPSQTLSRTNSIYQHPFSIESQSFLPPHPLFSDLETGPPDYSSLQGRKLYPGIL